MIEQKEGKKKVVISFECETLKSDEAAEDHIKQFMPKLSGLDAVGNDQVFLLYFQVPNMNVSIIYHKHEHEKILVDYAAFGSLNWQYVLDCSVNVLF